MKVAQFAEVGVPHEVIECVEVDDPGPPAADEVVVEVIACPINPADLLIMEGRYAAIPPLPAVPGAEFVGQVLEIGAEVDGLAPGQRVITVVRENWVQKRKVKAAELIPVPQGVDTLQLAMLKANPATAYLMMKKYVDLAPGDWLIQDAA
ncbi:MAG: alcohol dehydrogenase catalytic domain-containing protein, partial [Alphaproteobacteria bacterium]|nr:alcohol dehydrogenase catalytic domain-containing protein [Alphaproteobacteria bacterium]